jgi:ketosteroid isomerase-like protein
MMTRSNKTFWLAVVVLASAASPTKAQSTSVPFCDMTGPRAVADLSREWILEGWDRKATDGAFNFREKLGKYYDLSSPDVMLYDDVDPERRVVRNPSAYGAIWEPLFSAMRTAEHRLSIAPAVLVSGNLAAVNLQFIGRLTGQDGKITGIRTFTSLTWRCTAEGWKIVREHNSSTILPVDQIDSAMNAAKG